MNEQKRGCLTCKWADYLKTPTGRLVRGGLIRCNYPRPTGEQITALLMPFLSFAHLQYLHIQSPSLNQSVYGDMGDGSDCTKWEPTK
jgi:hypothetical protein